MKLNTILAESANNITHIENSFEIDSIEENYVISAISYLQELNLEFNNCNKNLCKGILESQGDEVLINESTLTFIKKINEIIKKFISRIKSIFNRFCTALTSVTDKHKYILDNQSKILSYNSSISINGFKFVKLDDIPDDRLIMEFSDTIRKFKNIDDSNIKEALKKDLLFNDNYYNNLRATALNIKTPVNKENFQKELFKTFRNGYDIKVDISFNPDDYKDILYNIKNSDAIIKKTKNTIDTMTTKIKNIESLTAQLLSSPIIAMNILQNYVSNVLSIYTIAMTSKLTAYKDMYNQNKDLCINIINEVNKKERSGL